jgi:hypothetical protein
VQQLLKLHEGGEAYHLFLSKLVRRVVGKSRWSNNSTKKLVSQYVTKSDEAYALLNVENQYDRWTIFWENDSREEEDKVELPGAMYTNCGQSGGGKGTNKKNDGWSTAGMNRFNELHKKITEDRKRASREIFEEKLRADLEAKQASKRLRITAQEEEDETGGAYAAHDFEDVSAAGLGISTTITDGDSKDGGPPAKKYSSDDSDDDNHDDDDDDEGGDDESGSGSGND